MTEAERNKCLADIDVAIEQMEEDGKKIELLKEQLAEAQTYKADAERYRWTCANYDDFTLIQHYYEGSEIEYMIDQAINESKPTKGVTNE